MIRGLMALSRSSTQAFPIRYTHTNEVRIVVLQGAYIYKPQNGNERRVGVGSYISIPGGVVHVRSGDPKEGALFYEESPGGFDLKAVDQKGKK